MPESTEVRFGRLITEHGRALRRLVAAYELDPDERDDLLQEIAFGIWRALPSFREACSERTFVFRIAHNTAITHGRRAATRRRAVTIDPGADSTDPRPDPDQQSAAAALQAHVLAALQQLSPALRQTMVLSLEGLSHGEMADVLGTTAGAVAVRLNRAREALSIHLRAYL
jgi:RNA polymerase sigma factor (sigma-70 family)